MKLTIRLPHPLLAAALLAAPLAFGLGRWTAAAPAPQSAVELPALALSEAPAPWRTTLDYARETADADALRTSALDMLDEAGSDAARAEALSLLGWVARPGDERLLEDLAFTDDPTLRVAAVQALGRLGTDVAVDHLVRLLERDDDEVEGAALLALGTSGHPRGLRILVDRVRSGPDQGTAAAALARNGTDGAARTVARAFTRCEAGEAHAHAMALASFPASAPEARGALHRAAWSGRGAHRAAARFALARAGDPGLYDALVVALEEGSASEQAEAATALGELGDPAAVGPLAALARTGPGQARSSALYALAQLDTPESTMALLDVVEEAPPGIAAEAVGVLHPDRPEVRAVLLWTAEEGPTEVRNAAVSALLWQPWPRGEVPSEVMALARAEVQRPTTSWWAGHAYVLLVRHGDEEDLELVLDLVREGASGQRVAAVQALGEVGSPAGDDLLLELVGDPDAAVQQVAIHSLMTRGDMGPALEARLLEHLDDEGVPGWGTVEQALAELGTPAALDALARRAAEGTARESRNALNALAHAGGAAHMRALEELLDDSPDLDARRRIYEVTLYASTGDPESIALAALEEGDPAIEGMAVDALARAGSPRSREVLLELCDSDRPETRSRALTSLAWLGGEEAEARLVRALEEPDLAHVAVGGLQQLGTPGAREAITDLARSADDPILRQAALSTLGWDPSPDSERVLLAALDDGDPTVRSTAITSLQSLGTSAAAEALGERLADADPEDEVAWAEAQQAAWALQNMGGRVARDHAALIEEITGVSGGDTGTHAFYGGEYFGELEW